MRDWRLALVVAILVVAAVVLAGVSMTRPRQEAPLPSEQQVPAASATPTETLPPATPTPEPLVPTLVPGMATAAAGSPALVPAASSTPESGAPEPQATLTPGSLPVEVSPGAPPDLHSRLGFGVPRGVVELTAELARQLSPGWYLDWSTLADPLDVDGIEFAQIVLARGDDFRPNRAHLAEVLAANPGALWLIGNEPDVPWQDNKTPEHYARIYHQLYTFIKTLDPTAQVAIGGVSQVTPLRLMYLERVLAAYEQMVGRSMPVDVWNVHAFTLREERDSWGVSIPPGFEDVDQGMLWEIEDHDDLDLFRQQILDFRRWMVRHGQRNKPLIVSEYGILMPEGYGFPPEVVADYMVATFDFLLNATDPEVGYPADDNRLVQRLAWYSFSDTVYPTGNLVDPETGQLTRLGQVFAEYAASLKR